MYIHISIGKDNYPDAMMIYDSKYNRLQRHEIEHFQAQTIILNLIRAKYSKVQFIETDIAKHHWYKIPNRITLAKTLKGRSSPEIIYHLEYNCWLDKVNKFGL